MKKINRFWKSYKNKTKIEKKAIKSIENALDFLFQNIPKEKIVSVYIKGSFVTREMDRKSDIDIVPIVFDNKSMNSLQKVRDIHKDSFSPAELLPLSLSELKANKNAPNRPAIRQRPDGFLFFLQYHKLVYGKELNPKDYPMRSQKEIFRSAIKVLKEQLIPMHKKGDYGFRQVLKQVFWITVHEQIKLGKKPPITWEALDSFVKDKDHIIHRTYYLRKNHTKDKKIRSKYMGDLEIYLERLVKSF